MVRQKYFASKGLSQRQQYENAVRSALAMLIFSEEDPWELAHAKGPELYLLSKEAHKMPSLLKKVLSYFILLPTMSYHFFFFLGHA